MVASGLNNLLDEPMQFSNRLGIIKIINCIFCFNRPGRQIIRKQVQLWYGETIIPRPRSAKNITRRYRTVYAIGIIFAIGLANNSKEYYRTIEIAITRLFPNSGSSRVRRRNISLKNETELLCAKFDGTHEQFHLWNECKQKNSVGRPKKRNWIAYLLWIYCAEPRCVFH